MCLASHAFEQVVQQPQHAFHVAKCNHITLSVGGEVQCRPCEFDRGFDTAGGTLYRYSQKVKLRNWRPLQIERKPQLTTIYARDDSGARCALSKISEKRFCRLCSGTGTTLSAVSGLQQPKCQFCGGRVKSGMPRCGGVCTQFSSNADADNDMHGMFVRFLRK
jgi:hypothetical protein